MTWQGGAFPDRQAGKVFLKNGGENTAGVIDVLALDNPMVTKSLRSTHSRVPNGAASAFPQRWEGLRGTACW
ncbi:hypothetical protein [Arthrobacter sp. zg-Y919]|uniref:hypothetical protein n=1 Tax=Arthrobacter sp. zg-Y919 TaxID=2894187 RepID=UPI0024DF5823|nr:hypothetical protein [Arthrobacter sp. zg-Y919]WIB02249.1 hypothetical protein QNO10_09765 [Arthrobacter sp. zg-Y919]